MHKMVHAALRTASPAPAGPGILLPHTLSISTTESTAVKCILPLAAILPAPGICGLFVIKTVAPFLQIQYVCHQLSLCAPVESSHRDISRRRHPALREGLHPFPEIPVPRAATRARKAGITFSDRQNRARSDSRRWYVCTHPSEQQLHGFSNQNRK